MDQNDTLISHTNSSKNYSDLIENLWCQLNKQKYTSENMYTAEHSVGENVTN